MGMCGGFVVLLGVGADRREAARRQAAYFAGKTATYALFGAVAGLAGGLLADVLAGFGGVLGVALGVAMVVAGLGLCGVAWGRSAVAARVAARLGPAIGRLVASERRSALVALGMLNGLLPCGLVYGMLAVAAGAGSAWAGALTMAVFGLATVPALAFSGLLGATLQPSRRVWMQRAAGLLVVAMGLLTVARGTGAFAPTGAPTAAPHDMVCTPGAAPVTS